MSTELKIKAYKDICDILIKAAGGSLDELFDVVRLVWHNLQQIERKMKKDIRIKLFARDPRCARCDGEFSSLKDVEVHRKDDRKRYTTRNCELVHKECHQHREKRSRIRLNGLDNRITRRLLGGLKRQNL